jgi:glycosyltransferase involved in cell wall biosynthesis
LVVKARAAVLPFTLLSERADLDDLDDLRRLKNRPRSNYPRTSAMLKTLPSSWSQDANSVISVIIPTLNEEKTLEATIMSVRANQYQSEIVVVDGGSSDRTLEIANRLADRVIITSQRGRQYQENVGAKGAKGEILLFLHADTVVSPTLLPSITKSLQDQGVVAGGAHLAYSSPERFRYRALCVLREMGSRVLGISGMGSSFFVRRDPFRLLGGFDEGMNEEAVDMCKRLRVLGRHIMLDEVVQTSARRYESSGFIKTVFAWAFTIGLSYFGIRAVPIEKYLWRVVR